MLTYLFRLFLQHPTAALIARTATAQDELTGDGTTSNVLLIGELLKQADLAVTEGVHPRLIADGFDVAKEEAMKVLEQLRINCSINRDTLIAVARTSLRTKVHVKLADLLTEVVVDAILTIHREGQPIDLFMVEMMAMQHKRDTDTRLVKGELRL